ncbi:MAG: bacillithiol biosynthesis cysteine-adding enzyme BshC [Calditrichaeota bacterium]|nr:MAG: bacillithiol biosynthesis cysteine-adding enzyme BshC [Calditrichota bacterium]
MRVPMSRLPGTSTLVQDYLDRFERVAEFFEGDYRNSEAYLERSDRVKSRSLPLGRLVPVLREQNERFGCGAQTLEKIDLLLERRACAVVTGQQTGLFGGPLFTLYKALTAIRLAERLNRTCEGCYVPVFWLASDDHDFREVNHVTVVNKTNRLVTLTYEAHPAERREPVSQVTLTEEIAALVHQLGEETHPAEFKDAVLAQLSEAYRPSVAFSAAFGTWLMGLLKSFGVIFIDASDRRIKALGSEIFRREIAEQSPSTRAALEQSARLVASGYHTQVQLHEGRLNLFYVQDERHAVEVDDGVLRVKGVEQTFGQDDFLRELEAHPERFSPNVILRPLFQDALLPTLAYVAGPGEIAYYAQMKGIYQAFGLTMPIIYPRKSLTLLEARVEKVLDKYGLAVWDFWGNVDSLINGIVRTQLPEGLEAQVGEVARAVQEKMQALGEVVTGFEPTLGDTVKNIQNRIASQLDLLEKKVLQAYKKRNEVIGQQLLKAQISLFPNHHLQERELNVLPYLFKHGFEFIDRLYEAMDISDFDHQIVRI